MNKTYDFIGVGLGPFNLGLACLTDSINSLNVLFLDKKVEFDWHPGLMIEGTTIQTPFMADLVTLADPTSPFSFMNYLKEQGRIYSFFIKENFSVLRNEYNHYCQWASKKINNIEFSRDVTNIEYDSKAGVYLIHVNCLKSNTEIVYRSKKLVLGVGTVPYIPPCCDDNIDGIIHTSEYMSNKKDIQSKKSITILGSGQSAAEVYKDLLQDIDVYGYELNWITRSPWFFPMENSKLTLELTSPDYIDYFYTLPSQKKKYLSGIQDQLYKGINKDLLSEIYDMLYLKTLDHKINIGLYANSELEKVIYNSKSDLLNLNLYHRDQERRFQKTTETLVLATGYEYVVPNFIKNISDRINWDNEGKYDVDRNYSIDTNRSEIFVQNAEIHSHGFTAPDLGMGCYRNSYIIKEITGKEYYPIEKRIAFQDFSTGREY